MAITSLNGYMQAVQRLLWDWKMELLRPADLTYYINLGRSQVSGEGECIRVTGVIPVSGGVQVYPFSAIEITQPGIGGVLNVRMISSNVAGNVTLLDAQPWEWFYAYVICQNNPVQGQPTQWAQLGQGVNGTIYLGPVPSSVFTLTADVVCYPADMATNASPEAIPYPWTDAVPYYAAYMAFLSAQKAQEAAGMFLLYEEYVRRARRMSTPSVLSHQYPQNTVVGRPAPLGEVSPQVSAMTGSVFPSQGSGGGGQRGG